MGSLFNGSSHVVALRFAAHRRFQGVLAIVFRDYGRYPIRGCGAAFGGKIGRTFIPHPGYIRVTDTESDIALSYWILCTLVC